MSQYRDYTKPIVGQSGCSYSNLGSTYNGISMSSMIPRMDEYLVPQYCPDGPAPNYPPPYDTLSHGKSNTCGDYFTLQDAFPSANCSSCLGKTHAQYVVGNLPSNIPADAFGQFDLRGCNSGFMPGCQPGVPVVPAPKGESFLGFLGF